MDRIVGRLTQADVARALREVAGLPGAGVHLYRTLAGDEALHAESAEALAQDLLDRLQVWRPTHRHYKGGEYREIARGVRRERFWTVPRFVLYDNDKGDLIARVEENFDGEVEVPQAPTKKQRFRRLNTEQGRSPEVHTISAADMPSIAHARTVDEHPAREGSHAQRAGREEVALSLTREQIVKLKILTTLSSDDLTEVKERLQRALRTNPVAP